MAVDDRVREGQQALADADWERASECFEAALAENETAEILDGLGRALHFQGAYPRAIDLAERAFAAYQQEGRQVEAADCARWLLFLHALVNANMAAAGGWLARAETLLDGVEECPSHGWLELDHAALIDDIGKREQLALSALAIARRFGDADLEYDALSLLGEVYVASGRLAEGMKLLDQAMTAVSAGEVKDVVALGDIVCRLLSACETALDVTRAEQWMAVGGRFEAWKDWVTPVCRNHYGGILVAVGRWAEAEQELEAAIRTFEHSYRMMRASPLVKLADLRVRQGRFEEAKRLLEGHETHPLARRALAAIALAEGESDLAEELVGLCIGEGPDDRGCAPALELLVRAQLARGNLPAARATRDRLDGIAAESGDARARAFADLARGLVAAADGDTATLPLQEAARRFASLDAPLEMARAQLELARALAGEARDAAIAEAKLALRGFERIGARADADAAAAFLRARGASGRAWARGTGALTQRESEVLALLGEGSSNAEIAERLVISKRTAEHHVASILSKLDLNRRAEAAAYAVRGRGEDS